MTSGTERAASVCEPLTTACLTTDEALDFAQGALSGSKLEVVDTHVDVCDECRELVIDALRGLNTGRNDSSPPQTTMFQKGTVVGERFKILRFVAKGGMGEVYEALDLEFETTVALKTVASLVADNERAVRYLKSEVLHARSIAHPNVCRTYEWGTHVFSHSSSRVHFFTMEFIRGERLGALLRRAGPLSVEAAVDVAHQLLAGLAAAHVAGVLHRDFKSDNVMLTETDGGPKVVILDFGLARPLDRESGSSSFGPVGTKPYMAPEQLEGSPLKPSADLYAFGVVLFEVLTGRRPFEAEDGTEPPLACLKKTPVAPSRFIADVPGGLDQFVLRCLRRDPRERYQSAREALGALATLVPRKVGRAGAWGKRRVAAVVVALGLAAGILIAAGHASFERPERSARLRARDLPRPAITNVSASVTPLPLPAASTRTREPPPEAADSAAPRPESPKRKRRVTTSAVSARSTPVASAGQRATPLAWESFEGPGAPGTGGHSELSSPER